jgi:hypothetical protein
LNSSLLGACCRPGSQTSTSLFVTFLQLPQKNCPKICKLVFFFFQLCTVDEQF